MSPNTSRMWHPHARPGCSGTLHHGQLPHRIYLRAHLRASTPLVCVDLSWSCLCGLVVELLVWTCAGTACMDLSWNCLCEVVVELHVWTCRRTACVDLSLNRLCEVVLECTCQEAAVIMLTHATDVQCLQSRTTWKLRKDSTHHHQQPHTKPNTMLPGGAYEAFVHKVPDWTAALPE
jgi:hypothetical protein